VRPTRGKTLVRYANRRRFCNGSRHDGDGRAAKAGADYVTLGPSICVLLDMEPHAEQTSSNVVRSDETVVAEGGLTTDS